MINFSSSKGPHLAYWAENDYFLAARKEEETYIAALRPGKSGPLSRGPFLCQLRQAYEGTTAWHTLLPKFVKNANPYF